MLPPEFYENEEKARRQARVMKKMKPEDITVETWLGGWRRLLPKTRSDDLEWKVASRVRPFRTKYGSRKMSSIRVIEAQAWALKNPSSVRWLREAWNRAVLMQVAPQNIWLFVVMPPRKKEKVRPPTDVELDMILERARMAELFMPRFVDLIEVAAFTGARQGGLVKLRRDDVDLGARRMTLTEKGNKTRTVILPARAQAALERTIKDIRRNAPNRLNGTGNPLLYERAWGHVWKPCWGQRLRTADVQAAWAKVRGDFPHGFHSLRHYCATWMREQGIDPLDVAVQLGHTDQEGRPYQRLVERVYDLPDPELALARVAAALD